MKETMEPIMHMTKHGVEIRVDLRFITLGAALTALSEPVPHEHPLVKGTRQYLSPLRDALLSNGYQKWIRSILF